MKGLYFPNENFLTAKIGYKASWGWQSTLAGRKVLCKGLRRQVGDGSQTKIWEDPWLPSFPSHKVQSPKPQNTTLNYVADLRQGKQWNDSLLHELFSPMEIAAIKNVLVTEAQCHDRWI